MLLHTSAIIIAVSLSGGWPPAELTRLYNNDAITNLTEYNKTRVSGHYIIHIRPCGAINDITVLQYCYRCCCL